MPKHNKGDKQYHHNDNRHGRRDSNGDRRGGSSSNDRDRRRDRSPDRGSSRDSNTGGGRHYDRGRDRHNDRSQGGGGRDDSRFSRSNHGGSNNYGYGPPGGVAFYPPPQLGPPPMLPYGGHGNMGMGIAPPFMVGMGMPGFGRMQPMGYPPGPHQGGHGHRRDFEDDRSRKRERNDYPRGRYEDDRSKRPRMDGDDRDARRFSGGNPNEQSADEDLETECAFRLDTEPNFRHLKYRSLNDSNTSRYELDYRRDDVFGASEEELNNIPFRSVFSRCVRPVGIDDHGNPVDDEGNILDEDGKPVIMTAEERTKMEEEAIKKKPLRKQKVVSATPFFSFENPEAGTSNKILDKRDKTEDGKKKQLSVREQVEKYNIELRENPKNVELWRKFAKFQDQVFENEAEEMAGSEKEGKKAKLKRNRKALAEKKIAILDKALESNPKDLSLHLDRLDLVYEVYKPRYVLGEWKKLVTVYQQLGAFWNEYLIFASTQLQLYSSSSILSTFEKVFQKFRLMLNPNYPSFQKPEKFLLLISDLQLGLSFILRDSGFTEKAVALNQAQLEIVFNFPVQLIPDKSKAEWEQVLKVFELFWDAGTQRFGEPDAPGWGKVVQEKYQPVKAILGVKESSLADWEDNLFDSISKSKETSKIPQSQHWLTAESFRSTFQWIPWRENYSDIDEVEDNQRMVLSSEVSPFLMHIPEKSAEAFEQSAAHFRSVVNFLLLLQDDLLPRTQTLDSILSPFATIALAEARTFFSEIYYWKTLLNLYIQGDEEISIPDGFDLDHYTAPGTVNLPGKQSSSEENEVPSSPYPAEILQSRKELTQENAQRYLAFVRKVVDESVKHLPPKLASLLALIYIRFEERSTYSTEEPPKARMKAAKSLLQNEKLRNSVPLYGEMAVLEYFCSKNKTKASDILLKAANSSAVAIRKSAETKEVSDLVNENWEILAELTRMYRLLAEIQLAENRNLSLQVLVALGNNLSEISLREDAEMTSTNKQLVARRRFEKILSFLLPEDESTDDTEYLHRWDGDKSVEYLVQNTNLTIEWISAFALFLYLSSDFESTSQLLRNVLERVKGDQLGKTNRYQSAVVNVSHMREQVYLMWCKIGILEIKRDPMQHGKFRQILVNALTEFPASPPLLLIFTEVEKQSSIAGKIWRHMTGVIKNESSLNSLHWVPLFMALGLARRVDQLRKDEEIGLPEFGLGGPAVPPDTIFHKLDAVLETAEQNRATRNCPLIWRIHMKINHVRYLKSKGIIKDDTIKSKFYDAMRNCPALKSLYMDALSYFPNMMKEVLDLMKEKQLYVRLPAEELNLLLQNEEVDEDDDDDNDGDGNGQPKTDDDDESEKDEDAAAEAASSDQHDEDVSQSPEDESEITAAADQIESMSEGEIDEDEQ